MSPKVLPAFFAVLTACGSAAAPAPLPPPVPPPLPAVTSEAPAPATVLTTEDALTRLFNAPKPSEDWFDQAFMDAVPIAKLEEVLNLVAGPLGPLVKVESVAENQFSLTFEKGSLSATAKLDEEGRFAALMLKPGRGPGLDEELASLKELPGKTSAVIISDDKDVIAHQADLPLAVGSTFKLAVLLTLNEQIGRGQKRWKDVVQLKPEWKSLPSGMLQGWPDGAHLTLETLASLMISISDNTATDGLISLVGREAIEKNAPRNKPLLKTGEMFRLKSKGGADLLERYRKGDEAARRAVLTEVVAVPLPKVEEVWTDPTALDVEWLFSTRELCALLKQIKDTSAVGINPGTVDKKDWERVAFKGGSEPGVMNLTTWVEKDGHSHCVSTTWNNDTKLDESKFGILHSRMVQSLAK